MTTVWVVSRTKLKAPPGTSSPYIYHPSHHRDTVTARHGRPTSEVGYTSATARWGDHESSYEHVVVLERKKKEKLDEEAHHTSDCNC